MRICGVDPGLQTTGYAIVDGQGARYQIIDAGTIRSDASASLCDRLNQIYQDLCDLLAEHKPARMSLEKLFSHYKHPQTAVLMGHVRGIIMLAAAQQEVPVDELAATAIKRHLTGNGRASKQQMQQAIKMQCNLPSLPEPHDVADAVAIALGAMNAALHH